MKKLLSIITVIAILAQASAFTLISSLAASIEIVSIEASDITVEQEKDTYLMQDEFYDEELGTTAYTDLYSCYYCYPEEMTVGYTSGGVYKEICGSFWDVFGKLGIWLDIESGQSFDSQWTPGGTYTCTISSGEVSDTFDVTVIGLSVAGIEVSDVPALVEGFDGRVVCDIDPETEEEIPGTEFFMYDFPEPIYTISYTDGRESISGTWDEIYSLTGNAIDMYTVQESSSPWGLGANTVYISYLGCESTFDVNVIESPVASVCAVSEPASLYVDVDDFYGFDTDEFGDACSDEYLKFAYPEDTLFEVTLKDGTSAKGTLAFLDEKYGLRSRVGDDQSFDAPWGEGEHFFTVNLMGCEVSVPVNVIDIPITGISVVSEPAALVELVDGSKVQAYDADGNEIAGKTFFKYYTKSPVFEVTLKDGSTFTGTDRELEAKFGSEVIYNDGQAYKTRWSVGDHNVTASFLGFETQYNQYVEACFVKSARITAVKCVERADGFTTFDTLPDGTASEPYFKYDIYPAQMEVTTYEGFKISGTPEEIMQNFGGTLVINDPQSVDNQWGAGMYTVSATYFNMPVYYNVYVVSNPVESIEFIRTTPKTTYGEWDLIETENCVLRVSYANGTYRDVTLGTDFGLYGASSYYEEAYDADITIENKSFAPDADTYFVKAEVLGSTAQFELEITPQHSTYISLENATDGYLYISSDVTGAARREKVTHIDPIAVREIDSEESLPGTHEMICNIETDNGGYVATLYFENLFAADNGKYYDSVTLKAFGLMSEPIVSSPWLDVCLDFDSLVKLFGEYDFFSTVRPQNFNGALTSENIDFACSLTASLVYNGSLNVPDVDLEWTDYYGDTALKLTGADLETLIREVFDIKSTSPIDFSQSSIASSFDGERYCVPISLTDNEFVYIIPYDYIASLSAGGFTYNVSTEIKSELTESGIGLSISFTSGQLISSIAIERTVLNTFVRYSSESKFDYKPGQELDLTDLTLVVEFTDGYVKEYTVGADMVTGYDKSVSGTQTLTVSADGYQATYDVTVAQPVEYMLGDVDCDGEITMNDLKLLKSIAQGKEEPVIFEACDLDFDGDIDMDDYRILKNDYLV